MNKLWVVCIDGTWNDPGDSEFDPVSKVEVGCCTNVVKTWEALTGKKLETADPYGRSAALATPGIDGEAVYFNGVGSVGWKLRRLFDGATGTGTSERIRDAYQWLAARWTPGDKIAGFGFSRGAYAVRALLGFIDVVGLPDKPTAMSEIAVDLLYGDYALGRSFGGNGKHRLAAGHLAATIDFVGVWDTVGALALRRTVNGYHHVDPWNATRVCHALALDEVREAFKPTLWTRRWATQKIDEVWFPGAHSNVGGGYMDDKLSNIALYWILREANSTLGWGWASDQIPGWDDYNAGGTNRNSYLEFWRNLLRDIGDLVARLRIREEDRVIPSGHKIHQSVLDAMAKDPAYLPRAKWSDKRDLKIGTPPEASRVPW